jgi:hypothetical protein
MNASNPATWGGGANCNSGYPDNSRDAGANVYIVVVTAGDTVLTDINMSWGSKVSSVGHAFLINGTNAGTRGTLQVASGVTLTLRGADRTNNTLGRVTQFGVFQPLPGSVIVGDVNTAYASVILNSGTWLSDATGGAAIRYTSPAANYDWTVAVSNNNGTQSSYLENTSGVTTIAGITVNGNGTLPWIANAAGTGLGSLGDSSLSFSAQTGGILSWTSAAVNGEVASLALVDGPGKYYVNYDAGIIWYWYATGATANLACKRLATATNKGWGVWSTDAADYNTVILRNSIFEYMGGNTSATGSGVVPFAAVRVENKTGDPAGLRYAEISNCTFRYIGISAIGMKENAGTAVNLIKVDRNTFMSTFGNDGYGNNTLSFFRSNNAFISVSNNVLNQSATLIQGEDGTGGYVLNSIKINSNTGMVGAIWNTMSGIGVGQQCSDCEIRFNNLAGANTSGSRLTSSLYGADNHPVVISDNTFAHGERAIAYSANMLIQNNWFSWFKHHFSTNSSETNVFTYNVIVRYNLFSGFTKLDDACVDIGYNKGVWIDGIEISHNTCWNNSGGFAFGDALDQASYGPVTRANIHDNLVVSSGAGSIGSVRVAIGVQNYVSVGADRNDTNYYTNPATVYCTKDQATQGCVTSTYDRGAQFLLNGGFYNQGARNVTGVSLWSPSYNANQTGGTLAFVFNSASDMTLAWNGTVAPVQLVWDGGIGAGPVTYSTVSGTDSDIASNNGTVTVSGTPWLGTGSGTDPKFPRNKFVALTHAGTTYYRAISSNTTNQLTVTPRWGFTPSALDPFVIINSEVKLLDSGGVDYVRAGILASALPTSSKSDTDIAITLTDVLNPTLVWANGGDRQGGLAMGFTLINPAIWCVGSDGETPGTPFCQKGKAFTGAILITGAGG